MTWSDRGNGNEVVWAYRGRGSRTRGQKGDDSYERGVVVVNGRKNVLGR